MSASRRPALQDAGPETFAGPLWAFNLKLGRVEYANGPGRVVLGGALREGVGLDQAMPALKMLRAFQKRAHPGHEETIPLIFWTPHGAESVRCRCSVPASADPDVVIAKLEEGGRTMTSAGGVSTPPLGPLAHELRTPLSAIMALAEVMKDERFGPISNARYLEYARDIYETSRHALSVVAGMLDGVAPTRGEPTDICEVAVRCLSAMRALAAKTSINLKADLAGPRQVAADPRSISQILLNLLSNALQFTPPGGVVTVTTATAADGSVVLSVSDTGSGMAQADVDRILSDGDALWSLSAGTSKSGYGLPLVKALARQNAGRLDIWSSPGQGTRVSVFFPQSPARGI